MHKLRKSLLIFLLPLLLLFAQQVAAVHEIGHFSDWKSSQSGGKQSPAGKYCEECFAFASISGATTSADTAFVAPDLAFELPASCAVAFIATDAPACRNRGPPAIL